MPMRRTWRRLHRVQNVATETVRRARRVRRLRAQDVTATTAQRLTALADMHLLVPAAFEIPERA